MYYSRWVNGVFPRVDGNRVFESGWTACFSEWMEGVFLRVD